MTSAVATGQPPPPAVATRGLRKEFRGRAAVDGIDLDVPAGSVFGFLGPNGSGKTTTIRMLLGLARATAGEAYVLGEAMPAATRRVLPRVGALVEGPAFYPFLSGRDNLRRVDAADRDAPRASRDRRIELALEEVGLGAAAGKAFRAYSLGMKQRLAIAAALLMPRELLVLDEPTNGLDPQGTREVRGLVRSLAAGGTTVFVSSHLLAEVEQICTHVGVMHRGRLVAQGALADLGRAQGGRVRVDTPDVTAATGVLHRLGLAGVTVTGERVTAVADGRPPEDVSAALVAASVRLRGFGIDRPNLEDTFVALTGEGFDVAG